MALGYRPRSLTRATGRATAPPRLGNRATLVWLTPFAIAVVYIAVFVVQLPHNLWVIEWGTDYASGFTMTTTLAKTGAGGYTVLGTTGAYVPLWFGLLTARLPLHRQLWELAPWALFALTAVVVGWSVTQVASRLAGALATLLILVASPRALYFLMAPVAHNTVYPTTALLGAYLVWLARGERRPGSGTWVVPVLGGLLLGVSVASDALLIVTGVVPFTATAIVAGLKRDRSSTVVALSAIATVLIAVAVAELTSAVMRSLGYVVLAPSRAIAPLSALSRHAELMWEGLRGLMGGYLSQTAAGGPRSDLGSACEVITVAALATVLLVGARTALQLALSAMRRRAMTSAETARALHILYWTASALTTSVAFALSVRTEYVHESYYATLIFSVAAIVALLVCSRLAARLLVCAGASIFFAASVVGLTSHYMESYVLPIARSYMTSYVPAVAAYAPQITAFAADNHAVVGYAGYGDASDLTWNSRERVLVRPVQKCATPEGMGMCPFFLARVPSWYRPERRRSFILIDSTEAILPSLPAGLGKPLATGSFGPVLMYVYPYDVATHMGPATDLPPG
jgi:hypothetical protein